MSMLRWGSLALLFVAVALVVILGTSVPVPMAARLGYRGAERRRALETGGLFAIAEPLVRFVAGLVALLPLRSLREKQELELRRADHCLGLTANEYSALSVLSGLLLGGAVLAICAVADASKMLAVFAGAFGVILPTIQIQEIVRGRVKAISRGLPHAIEIAAMCMGAGLDFPSALRLLADPSGQRKDPLARELSVILEELDLGHTRRTALLGFAERVPTQAVTDFVNAVIQAEQKGNPLAKVIQVQGRMLNMRRSVAAEEAAARAGVLMILPMMLLVACIMLLLIGPFIVNGMGF